MGHKGKFPSRAVDPCIASTSGSAISGQPPITVSKFKEKKHRNKNKDGAMRGEELFRFPCADCSIAKNEPENKTYTIAEFGEHYSNRHGHDDSGLFGCSMCDREFAAHSAALNHVKNCGVGVAVKDEQSRTLSQNSQPSRRATMRDTKPAGPQRARVTLNHPVSSLHSSFEEALQRSLNLYYSSVSIREKSAEKLSARKRKHSSQKSSPTSDTSLVVRCAEPGDTGKYINRGISCNILSQVDTGTETDSTQTSRADLGDICWQCGVYQVKGFMGLYDDYNKRSEDFRVFSGTEEPVPAEQLNATIGLVDDRSGRSVHSPSTIDTASNRVFNSPAEDQQAQQAVQAIAENIAAGVNCSNTIANFSSVSPTECDSTTSPLFYSSASSAYIGVPRSRSTSDPHWTRYPAHTGQLTPTILAPEPDAQETMDVSPTPVEETPSQIEPEFEVGEGALGHAGDRKEEETRFVDDSELSTIRAPQPQQQETPVKQATPTDEQVRKKMSIIAHMSKSTGVKSYLGKMSESIHIHDDSPPDDLNNPEEVKLKVRSRNVNPRAILEKIGCGVKESKLGKENEHGDSAAGCRLTASETPEVSVVDVTPMKPLTLSMTSIGKEIDRRVPPLKRYGPEIPPHLATAQVFEESRMNGGSDEQSSAPFASDRKSAASSTHIEDGAKVPFSLPAPIPVPVSQHSESSVLQPFSDSGPLLLPVQMQLFQGYDGRSLFDWSGYRETSAPQHSVDGYSLPKKRKRESEDAVIDVEGGGDDPTVIGHPSSIISQASPRTSDDIVSATTPSKQELSSPNDPPLAEETQSMEMKQCVIDSTDDEYESPGQQRISEISQPVVETAEPMDVVMDVERRSPDEVPTKMPDRDSFSEDSHRRISKIRTQSVSVAETETAEPKEVVVKVERRSPDEVPPKMADRDSKFSEDSHRRIAKIRTQPVTETAEPKEVVVKVERCSPDTASTKMSASLFSEVPKESPRLLLEKRIHESPVKNKSDLVGKDLFGEDACTDSSKFKEVPMCGFRKPSSASHKVRESLRHSHSVTKKTRTRATTSVIGNPLPARQPAFASVREKKPNIALRLPEQGAYIPPPATVEFEKRKSKKEKKEKKKKSDGRHKHAHPGSKERSPHLHHAKKRQDKEEPVVLMTQDVVKESPREVVEAVKVEKRTSRRIEPEPDPVKAKRSDAPENGIAKEAASPEGDVKWSPNSDDSKGGCLPSSAPVYSSMSTSDLAMPNTKNFSEFQSIVSPSDLLRLQANVTEKEKKDKMQSYIRFPAFFEMMENVIYEYCNGDPPGYFGTQYRDDYVKKLIAKTGNPHIERQLWFPDVVVKTESDMDVVTTTTNSEPTSDKEEDARKDKEEKEREPEREREESTKEDSFCSRAAQVARTMPFVDYETPYQHAEYWLSELTTRCGGLVNLHVECESRRDNTTFFVKMRLADELPTILSAVAMHTDKSEARLRAAFRLMLNLGKVAFFTANRPGQKMFAEKIVRAELFIRFIFDKMSTPEYDELKYLRAEAVSCSRKCCQLMDEAGSHVRLMFPIKMRQVERDDYGHWKEVPRKTYAYRPNAQNGGRGRYGQQDSWRRSAESTTSGSLTTSGFKSNPTYRPPSRENRERRSGGFGDLLPLAPVADSRPEVSTSSQPTSHMEGHIQRPHSNSDNNVHCARPQSSQSRETCVDPRLDTAYIRERERARESRRSEQQMEVPQDPRRRQRPSSTLRSDERAAKAPKRQHSALGREKSSESWIKREAGTIKTEEAEAAIIVLPTINVCSYASQERRKSLTQREDEYKKHGYAGFNGVPILCVPPPPPPRPPPQRGPYVAEGYAASWAEPLERVSYHEEAASQTQRSSRSTQEKEKDLPATYARHLGSEDEERSRPVYQRTYGQSAKSEREKSKGRKLYKPSPLHPGNVEAYKQEHGSPIVHQGGEVPQLEEDKDIRSDSVGRHTRRTESVDRHSSDSRRSLNVTHRNDWSQQDQHRRRSGPVNYSNNNNNNNNQRWRARGGQRDMNRGQDVNHIKTDGWRWRNNGGNGGQGQKGLNTDQQRDRRSCSNGGGGRQCRPYEQDRPK